MKKVNWPRRQIPRLAPSFAMTRPSRDRRRIISRESGVSGVAWLYASASLKMWRSTPSGHQQALFWAWRPYPRAQDRGVKAAPFLSKSSALITKRPVMLVSFRPRSQNPSVRFRLVQEIPWHRAAPRQKRCKCFIDVYRLIESHENFPST